MHRLHIPIELRHLVGDIHSIILIVEEGEGSENRYLGLLKVTTIHSRGDSLSNYM